MELLLIQGLILIGTLIWGYYQSKSHKVEEPEPAGLDTSRLPMLADRPIPVAFGRVWIMAPQVLCYDGPYEEDGLKDPVDKSDSTRGVGTTTHLMPFGRGWMMRLHLGLCVGRADSIDDVMIEERRVSSAFIDDNALGRIQCLDVDDTALRITSFVRRVLDEDRDNYIGAPAEFPGFMGEYFISYGGFSDSFPGSAKAWISEVAKGLEPPDFRGITSIVSNAFWQPTVLGDWPPPPEKTEVMRLSQHVGLSYIGPTKQPPVMGIELTRIRRGWNGLTQWRVDDAEVFDGDQLVGMNPAHIIRELLVSEIYGLGEPISRIDNTSFSASATTLKADKIGINFVWETQAPIRDLIDEVLKVAEGILWFDHANGLWKLTMIRADYALADTPIINGRDVSRVDDFSRSSWDDLPNQITVSYRDPDTWEDKNYTITNSSLQSLARRIVSVTVRYASVTNRQLAATLASRDLRQAGTPLARVNLKLKPTWSHLRPGDVVRWTSDDYGIVEMPLRVMSVNVGDGRNNEVTIRCVEDVFGLGTALYPPPGETPWTPPEQTPVAPEHRHLYEAPYWLVKRARLPDPESYKFGDPTYWQGYVAQLAAQSQTDSTGYLLEVSPDGYPWVEAVPSVRWQTRTTLRDAIGRGDTTITIGGSVTLGRWPPGTMLLLTDGTPREEEIAVITGVDATTQTLTVARGCLDTVPAEWAAGAAVWVPERDAIVPIPLKAAGTSPSAGTTTRVRSITSRGVLPADEAIVDGPVWTSQRWPRPYPPTAVTLDDVWRGAQSYPGTVLRGDLTLRWAYRRRPGSESVWPDKVPTHATPDSDETCTVEVRDASDDSLLASYTPAGDSQAIPASVLTGVASAYILLWTSRAVDLSPALDSWQKVRLDVAPVDNLLPDNVATGTDTLADTTGFAVEAGGITLASSTDQAHAGVRSLKATHDGLGTGLVSMVGATGATVGDYTATLWARTASGEREADLTLVATGGIDEVISTQVTLTDEWQLLTVRGLGVGAASDVDVMLILEAVAGTVYLDTVTLTRDP